MTDWQNRIVGMELVPVNQLLAHPHNARRHPVKQREALRGSLDSVGIVAPIIVNKRTNFIVDGHARVEEALTKNDEIEFPVIYIDVDENEEALILASFDFITYMAQYDADNLDALLQQVNTDNTAMQNLLSELAEDNGLYFGDEPQVQDAPDAQIDRAEELLQKWGVVAGDIWEIPSHHGGVHRLMCGDSTSAEDVALLMGGEKADCVFTDPPYNLASENKLIASDVSPAMMGLKNSLWDHEFDIQPFLDLLCEVIAENVTVYICTSHHLAPAIWNWMSAWAAHHSWCAWVKPNPMPSLMKRHWTWNAELVCYATRGKHTFNFPSMGHAPSVWQFPKEKETDHPTEKPVSVVSHALSHSTINNHRIYDGFGGSGTTMVACEQLARQCRMMELEPKYCAVILQRMQDMSLEPRKVN